MSAHSSGVLGEEITGQVDNLFPILCKVAEGKLKTLNIYGKDWPTRDGTCIRDYIHIMDLVDGHIFCLKDIDLNKSGKNISVFNVGTGHGTSVLEFIKVFEKVNQIKINYRYVDRRNGDCAILVANCDLIKDKLNWQTKKGIEDICKDGWNWRLKNL